MKSKPDLWKSKLPALAAILVLLSVFQIPQSAFAAASPLVIPFQGEVTNQQNQIVADGTYSLIFNLYDVAVGGQPLWTERHTKVGVVGGMVNLFLGSITSLAGVDFSQTRYLGITVDVDDKPTTADPEMVPRQMIIPAFYAKTADKLTAFNASTGQSLAAAYGWSAVFNNGDPDTGRIDGVKLADSGITTAKLADSGVTTAKIADGTITAADLSTALQADSVIPPGTVAAFAGATAPTGWLLCDGSAVSRSTYSRLFAAINAAHGQGNGSTTFNLPDYRGRFLRGVDGTAGRDPDKATRTAMQSGGDIGNNVGSVQSMEVQGHSHYVASGTAGGIALGGSNVRLAQSQNFGTDDSYILRGTGQPADVGRSSGNVEGTGSETRPINAYVNFIIKY